MTCSKSIDRLIVSGSAPPSALPPLDHGLDDASLVAKLREWKGTPPELLDNPDVLAAILEPLRDDLAMLERLRQQVPGQLDLPIHALAGRQDDEATATAMQGWRALPAATSAWARSTAIISFRSLTRAGRWRRLRTC